MKGKNVFWGVFLILAAMLVIISQVMPFTKLSVWAVIAAVLLIAWLISGITRLSFVEILLPLALLYALLQGPLTLFYISPWILIMAALLAGIGLSVLIRRKPKWSRRGYGHHNWQGDGSGYPSHGGPRPDMETIENDDDDHPFSQVRFGATSKYLHSEHLENGEFRSFCGALEVYFDDVTLAEGKAQIYVDCSLGAIKLYVPRNWQVVDSVNTSLGGVSNETRMARVDENSPRLEITGNVSLGGIEVAYV